MTGDIDMLISAFGNPKETMLRGIDWHVMGIFNGKNLIAQVAGTEGSREWLVKGMRGSDALRFVEAIIEQTEEDLQLSHVPTDAATGLESFRVDNELNIQSMREVGGVDGSYNMMRYTFGPPKSERNTGNLVEWRLIGLHQGSWVPAVIRQPAVELIEDAEQIMEWQVRCCCCCHCCHYKIAKKNCFLPRSIGTCLPRGADCLQIEGTGNVNINKRLGSKSAFQPARAHELEERSRLVSSRLITVVPAGG